MGSSPADPICPEALDALASAHVARLACGASPAERQAIFDWVAADPRHAVAFARMEAAWESAERLRAHPPPLEARVEPFSLGRATRRRLIGGSAAAMVLAGGATIAWRMWDDVELYRTGVGERRVVRLADGSRVHLNTASTIEAAIGRQTRRIRLVQGEAMFEVEKDAARPFLVDAGTARLRALGTVFNVRLRDEVVELTVTQGVVAVAMPDSERQVAAPRVTAGGGAVVRSGAVAASRLEPRAVRQRTAWQEGVIELDGETLAQVVGEFNRYRQTPIVIGEARLGALRVGGRFQVDESEAFLKALSASFPVRALPMSDGGVLLVGRAASDEDFSTAG